jgi:hypothetical protein
MAFKGGALPKAKKSRNVWRRRQTSASSNAPATMRRWCILKEIDPHLEQTDKAM